MSAVGKMKTKDYSGTHSFGIWAATTKAGAAIERHCLISFGRSRGRPFPSYFFPTLPPSETCFMDFHGVFERFNVLKRFVDA
jgi:hypothetical protein